MYQALLRVFGRADVALLLQALAFGLLHDSWGRDLAVVMGIWFGLARVWSGSIWVSALVHVVDNVTVYTLYGKSGVPIHLLNATPVGIGTPYMTAVVVTALGILFVWWRFAIRRTGSAARPQL